MADSRMFVVVNTLSLLYYYPKKNIQQTSFSELFTSEVLWLNLGVLQKK